MKDYSLTCKKNNINHKSIGKISKDCRHRRKTRTRNEKL